MQNYNQNINLKIKSIIKRNMKKSIVLITLVLLSSLLHAQDCPSSITDIDGNTYKTVEMGAQCWMAENLRATRYSDGTAVFLGDKSSLDIAYRYSPLGMEGTEKYFGYLYNWKAVMRSATSSKNNPSGVQGICPKGWHVPSAQEWFSLYDYAIEVSSGNAQVAAKALASKLYWATDGEYVENSPNDNPETNNATGFSAVPAGVFSNGDYLLSGYLTSFWCATEKDASYAHCNQLDSYHSYMGVIAFDKGGGFSVRCVRDLSGSHSNSSNASGAGNNVNMQDCPPVTDVDGNTYKTVKLGAQCWMAENLRTTRHANGTYIPIGGNYASKYTAYRYYPDNDPATMDYYGCLYNWKALMGNSEPTYANPSGIQGICPNGWHIPSAAEWSQLGDYVGSQSKYRLANDYKNIAKSLASTYGWHEDNSDFSPGNNQAANNSTGFSAPPAGYFTGEEHGLLGSGLYSQFWSCTKYGESSGGAGLNYFATYLSSSGGFDDYGLSVRCVRD